MRPRIIERKDGGYCVELTHVQIDEVRDIDGLIKSFIYLSAEDFAYLVDIGNQHLIDAQFHASGGVVA